MFAPRYFAKVGSNIIFTTAWVFAPAAVDRTFAPAASDRAFALVPTERTFLVTEDV